MPSLCSGFKGSAQDSKVSHGTINQSPEPDRHWVFCREIVAMKDYWINGSGLIFEGYQP